MQKVEAATEADHPFSVFDVERSFVESRLLAHLFDMFEVAMQQRQQIGAHLRRHVGQQGREPLLECRAVAVGQCGQVEPLAVAAVDDERVLVGLEAADQRIDCTVCGSKDVLDLSADLVSVGDGRFRVVVETGAAALRIALGVVVGDEEDHAATAADHALYVVGKHFAKMWPAEVEHAAEVAEGHQDAHWGVGGDGDIDTPVHALEHGDRRRVLGQITFTRQPGFGAAEIGTVAVGQIEEPAYAFLYGFAVNGHQRFPPECVGEFVSGTMTHLGAAAQWYSSQRRYKIPPPHFPLPCNLKLLLSICKHAEPNRIFHRIVPGAGN